MASISVLVRTALFVLPSIVSAMGDLGFSLGVKRSPSGSCKDTDDYRKDLDTISSLSKTIRVYAVSDCSTMEMLMPAVKEKGFKVVLGVWPTDDDHFTAEKDALKKWIPKFGTDDIHSITVGSEHLYRKDLTGDQLADKIKDVRKVLKDLGADSVKIGFADAWNRLQDGTGDPAIKESDIILANAFSYWEGQKIENATARFSENIMKALTRTKSVKSSSPFDFWVGETNWPTGGKDFGDSVPSTDNARIYWRDAICGFRTWGINVFVFEAFDEHWKPLEKDNDVESHWGVWDLDHKPKYELTC